LTLQWYWRLGELKEFLERWDQLPELKFAELIDGVVYLPSAVSLPHGDFDRLGAPFSAIIDCAPEYAAVLPMQLG